VVAPCATVTDAGTETTELLLVRSTSIPPLAAAALKVTVQESFPVSGIELLLQFRAFKEGAAISPIPLSPTSVAESDAGLVVTDTLPVAAPEPEGVNVTLKVYLPPAAAKVMGRLFWVFTVNPVPVTLMPEI
jgi:hypothetical protein